MLVKNIEEGEVIKLLPRHKAKVKIKRHSQCIGCQHKGFCDPFGKEFMIVEARNTIGAKVGQRVEVKFPSYNKTKAMFILYIIPLFSLILGAILGNFLNPINNKDLSSAIFSILFVILSFVGIKFYTNLLSKKNPSSEPQIINIYFENKY